MQDTEKIIHIFASPNNEKEVKIEKNTKKVITANIGGYCFTIEEDAYARLENYLNNFRTSMANKQEATEVMEDVEQRISEIFREHLAHGQQVVDTILVGKVIAMLGMPDEGAAYDEKESAASYSRRQVRRFYRNPDDIAIGGVCSGLAAYFGIDKVLVRLLFLIGLFFMGVPLFIYIVLWIVTPKANTIAEKLEMQGKPVTMQNILKYAKYYSS